MNATFNNVTLLGQLNFGDGSSIDSTDDLKFVNVSGFSRNLVDGTTSLLQDKFVLNNDLSCPTEILTPNISLQNVKFLNDLDENGTPVIQNSGFSQTLKTQLLQAQATVSSIVPDIIEPPLKKAKLSVAEFISSTNATSINDSSITMESLSNASISMLEPNHIYLRNVNGDTGSIKIDDTDNSLTLNSGIGRISFVSGLDMHSNNIVNIQNISCPLNGNLQLEAIGNSYIELYTGNHELRGYLDKYGKLSMPSSNASIDFETGIFEGSFTGNLTGAATQVNVVSDNTNGTYYIPFVKTSATGNKQLFIDDVTGPFTYNPNSNSLSGTILNATNVNVVATNTTNTNYSVNFSTASGNTNIRSDTAFTFNPSTNVLTVPSISSTGSINCPLFQNTVGNVEIRCNTTGAGGDIILTGGTNLLSSTSGGNANLHLSLVINGTTYKIALLNP